MSYGAVLLRGDGKAQTVGNVIVSIGSFALVNPGVYLLTYKAVCSNPTFTVGSASALYACLRFDGVNIVQEGSNKTVWAGNFHMPSPAITFSFVGDTLNFNVDGIPGQTLDWIADIELHGIGYY